MTLDPISRGRTADLELDYGQCKYQNPHGLGSTIIDLTDYSVIRFGCVYGEIRQILAEECDIPLPPQP